VLRTAGGTGIGIGVGIGIFAGTAAAHEVAEIVFCECLEVTVKGALLLGSDEPDDATGDGGYRAVLYCDGGLVRRPLEGTQDRQHYRLLEDDEYDHEDCQIIAVEGETWHPEHSGMAFRICNEHCEEWDCADEGIAAQEVNWCDDPSDIPSGGGAGGVNPEEDIVVTCTTDCLPLQGCTPGFWCQPAQRNGWWSDKNDVGGFFTDDTIGEIFGGDDWLNVGGRGGERGRGGPNTANGEPLADRTLGEAVCDLSGGPDLADAQSQLAGHATAALLNAAHGDINYPMTVEEVIIAVKDVLGESRDDILDQKDVFDEYNNLGCSLDAHGNPE
jgi:hypothetical protein